MDILILNSNVTNSDFNETTVQSKENEFIENEVTLWEIIQNLLPNIGSSAMNVFIILIEVHFIGLTKDTELFDGIGLAEMYMSLLIYNMGFGFSETITILCSKSFGSSNFRLLGIQTNQIRLIVTIYFLFIVLFNYFFCEVLLYIIVGEASYIHITITYIYLSFPSYYLKIQYDIFCKHSESQLIYLPIMISMILTMILHPILSYTLINYYDLNVYGVIIATFVSESVKFLSMFVYFYFVNPFPESNFLFSKDIFKDFWKITKLSSYSAILFFAEYVGFSVSGFFAAKLGEISYAKHLIISNITFIPYVLNYGFLNTVSILIGNYVGENRSKKIKQFIKYILIMSLITEAFTIIFVNVFNKSLVHFFNDNEIISYVPMSTLVFIMSIYSVMDMLQSILQGILRGLGIIHQMVYYSVSIFLIIQPTLNYLFIYVFKLDLEGLWIAIVLTMTFLVFVYQAYICFKIDIEKVCTEYELLNTQNNLKESMIRYENNSLKVNNLPSTPL